MIKTVIFDMDGVIVDTEPVHHYAYQLLFRQLKIDVSDEMYAHFTGNSTRNVIQKLKSHFGLPQEGEQLVQAKRDFFNAAFDHKQDLYLIEGVEQLISALYNNGMQLILASSASKSTIHKVFTRFGLHQFFSHIVSGEDFANSKPDPSIFVHAASLSNAPKKECIVIEDSTNGVIAAKDAGLHCIGYESEHSKLQDLSRADCIVSHFDDLNYTKIRSLF